MTVSLAPAKINLSLEVLGRRDDGYHTLRSVMVPIGLLDRIEFERKRDGAAVVVDAPQEIGADNLVSRALAAAGASGLDVRVTKNIPIGGGLGGGSSDAAAVLRAAMSGDLGPTACDDWLRAARDLGSDVPFFLTGTAALVEGTGERVTALGALPNWWAVVVRPHASVPTAEAYRLLDASRAEAPSSRPRNESSSLRAVDALQRKDFAALQRELNNDFHEPILRAFGEIARADAALRAAAGNALLSGSGSCLFALFEDERAARRAAERVDRASYEALFVVPFAQGDAWR
jgi:4-diphosphocytidyl-2-C-methyl-D-erythritol kinase